MIYQYKDNKGNVREINASMKNPPPEKILLSWGGIGQPPIWAPATDENVENLRRSIGDDALKEKLFTRVYGDFQVNTFPCTGKFPVASTDLPKNMPGQDHDHNGRTIIYSKAHRAELARKAGMIVMD